MKSYHDGKLWHAKTRAGTLSAPTPAELSAKFEVVRARASAIAGRPISDNEVENGIPKAPLSPAEQSAIRRKRALAQHAERTAVGEVSPEAARLAAAKVRADAERRSKLTTAERELEDATRAAQEADQKRADEVARAEIMGSKSYQALRSRLDELLFVSSFDGSVSAAELSALSEQSDQLEATLDIGAVRANVTDLQRAIQGRIDIESVQLREAADALEKRKRMLGAGTIFDDVGSELVGQTEYVSLTVGTETKKISKERYDTRTSDEALRSELFSGGQPHV